MKKGLARKVVEAILEEVDRHAFMTNFSGGWEDRAVKKVAKIIKNDGCDVRNSSTRRHG